MSVPEKPATGIYSYVPFELISTVPFNGLLVTVVFKMILSPSGSPSFPSKSPTTVVFSLVTAASVPANGGLLSAIGNTTIVTFAVSHNVGIPSSQIT